MVDTKKKIAEAADRLIFEKHKNKITVTDIVEECQLTRQAFYYHFNDIPDMIRWVLSERMERVLDECLSKDSSRDLVKCLVEHLICTKKDYKRLFDLNYKDEYLKISREIVVELFNRLFNEYDEFKRLSDRKQKFIVNYHCFGFINAINQFDCEDTDFIIDEFISAIKSTLKEY